MQPLQHLTSASGNSRHMNKPIGSFEIPDFLVSAARHPITDEIAFIEFKFEHEQAVFGFKVVQVKTFDWLARSDDVSVELSRNCHYYLDIPSSSGHYQVQDI